MNVIYGVTLESEWQSYATCRCYQNCIELASNSSTDPSNLCQRAHNNLKERVFEDHLLCTGSVMEIHPS